MLESELQTTITAAAELGGWTVAHFRPARTKHGWRTPGMYQAAGWPDLFMVRAGVVLAWELKASTKVTDDQRRWLELLADVPNIDARVIRPADLDDCLVLLLSRPGKLEQMKGDPL